MATRTQARMRQGHTPQETLSPTVMKEIDLAEGQIKSKHKRKKNLKAYCMCRGPDDGSSMIQCSECDDWYHFRCVRLSEREAEDIVSYVCLPCHEKTGLRTIMEWEGPDAFEDNSQHKQPAAPRQSQRRKESTVQAEMKEEEPSSTDSEDSQDEYIAEKGRAVTGKQRVRRVSSPSDSDGESIGSGAKAHKKARRTAETTRKSRRFSASPSPGPSGVVKRKQSFSHPEPKRKKSESDDKIQAARNFCLSKLEELFCRIFLRYPYLVDGVAAFPLTEALSLPKKSEVDLTDEDKERLQEAGKSFAAELEDRIFQLYPDSTKSSISGKYKAHFQMLMFNLSKHDRVMLHTRIAASQMMPRELSMMSSQDLADEQMKHHIKQREQEALEHSILQKQLLPRAKITHKGIENIEDVNGTEREAQRRREEEEQDRIERERLARIRVQASRAASGSIPPESPITPQTPSWGAPPAVPQASDLHGRPPLNPPFGTSASDMGPPIENELNLADLINMDDETPTPSTAVDPSPTPFGEPASPDGQLSAATSSQTTGISPFAAQGTGSDAHSRPSFDLNSFWTPKAPQSDSKEQQAGGVSAEPAFVEPPEHPMDVDFGEEADDQDFDMFLGKDEDASSTRPLPVDLSPEAVRAAFEVLPQVWTGTLSMPLDSTMPQEVPVEARQSGGRTLDDALLWQTLFPSRELRIDGRVPVEKSAEYLTQMRLNPMKELIAVAFVPTAGLDDSGFQKLTDHLIGKGRHGLVFPWGQRPKEHAPGREFYIIPLPSSDPLPEYMELLDDLKLPKSRNATYLIGIWVLNKGKLAPPPTPAVAPVVASVAQPPPTAVDLAMLQHTFAPATPGVFPSNFPPPIAPGTASLAPAPTPVQPFTSTLAAEVASLTPEQVAAMLRNLSYLGPQVVPPAPAMPLSQSATPPIPLQPFVTPSPMASTYNPSNVSYGVQQTPLPPHSRSYHDTSYDHYDGYGQDPYEQDYGHHGGGPARGGYRRGGPRGRGRPNDRQRDGGYSKNRGRGRGGYGPSSPPRDRRGAWGDGARW